MALQWKNPSGGISPLGKITVAVPGTPIPLNTNVGAQGQANNKFASRFRQLTIAANPNNTKPVYLCWNGTDRTSSVGCFEAIPPGERRAFPDGSLLITSAINIDNLVLDADVGGESAFAWVTWG